MKKVLVLEDESSIRSFIVINLRRAGYEVVEAEPGEEALEKLKIHSDVRVALLDIMLPGIDGFEVCRRIRATNAAIGIIMLTARSQEMDKGTGLMTGADDYVTKPFSPAELTARVDALMRRSGGGVVDAGEIDQPPFLLAYGNAFFGQGAVAQGFAHCAGGRALAHGGNTITVFGSFGHKAREVIIRKRNMSQRIHSCDHLRSSLWNTDEFPASGLTLLPGSMCVSYS